MAVLKLASDKGVSHFICNIFVVAPFHLSQSRGWARSREKLGSVALLCACVCVCARACLVVLSAFLLLVWDQHGEAAFFVSQIQFNLQCSLELFEPAYF